MSKKIRQLRRDVLLVLLCASGLLTVSAGLRVGRNPLSGRRVSLAGDYAQQSFRATVEAVDAQFRAAQQRAGLEAAAPADSLQIARRISLALTGTVPSLEEIRTLQHRVPESRRIRWWTDRCLSDRRSADYLAERLARAQVGTEDGPFLIYRRRRFVSWLSDALAENRAYHRIVRQLLSDSGTWTDSPAVNFLTVTSDPEQGNKPSEVRLASRVCRALLGLRIDCLQCHDDRLGTVELGPASDPEPGMQSHFHQLAAYFSEADASLLGIHDRPRSYRYQYLYEDEEAVIDPEPPFLPELMPEDIERRRARLAAWVTHPRNKPFARATVNRVWALMFGRPLVEPVDDIPLHGELPPGLETLAEDFAANGYDLRRLIRLIVSTKAFQCDSRAEFEVTSEHEAAWAVFPLSRLRPEQVAGALLQACSLKTINAQSHILFRLARFGQQNDFVKRYGDTGEDEFAQRGGTVTQRLLMMNGELVKEKTKENPLVNASTLIARYAPEPAAAIETAYLAVLTRRPTAREQRHFVKRLTEAPAGASSKVLEDLFWVLVNSTEFSWNH